MGGKVGGTTKEKPLETLNFQGLCLVWVRGFEPRCKYCFCAIKTYCSAFLNDYFVVIARIYKLIILNQNPKRVEKWVANSSYLHFYFDARVYIYLTIKISKTY